MFNSLYSRLKKAMIISVLLVLVIHLITVMCMYLYITDRDCRTKNKDISMQISSYITMRCQRIAETVRVYCTDGKIGDAVHRRTANTNAMMLNVISVDESIVNYIIIDEDYICRYDTDSYNIYEDYLAATGSGPDNASAKWHIYNNDTNSAILSTSILDSKGNSSGIMLLEIDLKRFCNDLTENAYVCISDDMKVKKTIVSGNLKASPNAVACGNGSSWNYYDYTYPFDGNMTLSVYFSRNVVYFKTLRLFFIILFGYAGLFIAARYCINKYLDYMDNSLTVLGIDMNGFIKNIEK